MKTRNYHYYGSQVEVQRLAEEYAFLGRKVLVEPGHLTVLALPEKKRTNDPRRSSHGTKTKNSE